MRFEFKPSFDRSVKSLSPNVKQEIKREKQSLKSANFLFPFAINIENSDTICKFTCI